MTLWGVVQLLTWGRVYRNNLLMTKNYLFETCRGYFNWNKLMRKSVHLVGNTHIMIILFRALLSYWTKS